MASDDDTSSEFKWNAVEKNGVTYLVIVHSSDPREAGDFLLRVEAVTRTNVCDDAVRLDLPLDGLTEVGSTFDANRYRLLETCYSSVNSPAKVYAVTSRGGIMTARVEGYGESASIAVSRESSCFEDGLQCVSQDDGEVVTWDSEEEEDFF